MNRKQSFWLPIVLIAAMLALVVGCSTKSVQDGSNGDNVDITLTASPSSVSVNGTSVVEATVLDGGSALSGQTVSFTVSPSSAGYFTPTSAVTDQNGVAGAIFTATSSGTLTLGASTEVGSTEQSTTLGVTVSSTQQTGGNINISVDKSLLLADGTDSAVVTVTARDALGQVVPNGTLLAITAGERFVDIDENGYWSEGVDSLVYDYNGNDEWDAFGLVPSYVEVTGSAGQAQFVYHAGSDAGTVYLKVTVTDANIGGSSDLALTLTSSATINAIFLSSDSLNLTVKSTGGIEIASITATGYDRYGNAVPEGQAISFIITDGPGGGEHLDTAGYGPYTALTNSLGEASVPLHSGTVSGTIRIRAYADSILSNATQVMVSAGPPAYIVIGSEDCNVDYWDNVGEFVGITAVVSDIYNNPVPDSTAVYFTCDEGTMKSHQLSTRNLEGIASTDWISGNNVPTADGRVIIIAETSGGNVADTGMFYNTHYPDTLIVVGVPASMAADGESKTYVRVTGYDLNGNPVIGGTSFTGEAIYLNASGGSLEDGCYSATDRVELTSSTLDMDYSLTGVADDGIGAVDIVTYWHSAGAETSFSVNVTTGYAYRGNSKLASVGTPSSGSDAYFTITIKDRWGNPLGDHAVNITTPAATPAPVPSSVMTNSYGEAYFSWLVPGAAGEYTITAIDTDARGGVVLSTTVSVEE
ncbi:MAG TPA: hypothetical protein PLF13_12870 [candidate division Zixibacteria bacterium]|nr:hypothetical protein [candidate division Zixibacteria bacterium]